MKRDKGVYKRPFDSLLKNKNLVGVEIGVLKGFHALEILQSADIKKLYLIDPWIDYSGDNGDESFEYAKKVLKDYSDVLEWIRKTSEEGIKLIPDVYVFPFTNSYAVDILSFEVSGFTLSFVLTNITPFLPSSP